MPSPFKLMADPREPDSENGDRIESDGAGASEAGDTNTDSIESVESEADVIEADLEPVAILSLDEAGVDMEMEMDDPAESSALRRPPTRPPATPTSPPPQSVPVVEPATFEIEVPTALDIFLDEQNSLTVEEKAARLGQRLEAAPPPAKAELAYELGELALSESLGDEARAVKAYGVALRADPSLRANLWAIRRIFYRRGLWPNLIKLIGAEIRFAEGDREKSDLELERGLIHEDQGSDEGAMAKACYSRAVAHDPTYRPALMALERRALVDGDSETLEMVWRHLAELTVEPDRKQIYLSDVARLLADRNDNEAFPIFDQIAEFGDLGFVSRERMRAARKLGEPEQTIVALDEAVRFHLTTLGPAGLPPAAPRDVTEPPSPSDRVRLAVVAARRKQAQVAARELGDTDRAWAALEQALAANPSDQLVLSDLADLADATGRYEELAELVASWQAQEAEPERARALSLRRVLALRHSDNHEAASSLLAQLSNTYPGYLPLVAIRESDLLANGDLEGLHVLLAELAEAAAAGSHHGDEGDPDLAVASELFTTAAAVADVCGEVEKARGLYARAVANDRENGPARDGLITCLERAGEWANIDEELSELLDGEPLWRLRAAHARMAGGDTTGALEFFDVLLGDLGIGELLWVAALAISVDDRGREANALEAAAERCADPSDAAELLGRAGRVLEQTEKTRAIAFYNKALAVSADDELLREALASLLRRERQWKELATVLRDGAKSGAKSRDSRVELARVCEQHLDDRSAAAEAYRDVLASDPADVVALDGLIRTTDGAEKLAALQGAAESDEPGTALCASLQLALMHREAREWNDAMDAARRAADLEADLGHRTRTGALLALDIACGWGDREALTSALERLGEASGGRTQAQFLAAAGWHKFLLSEGASSGAGDSTHASALFKAARDANPEHRGALLGTLLAASGQEQAAAAETLAAALTGDALAVSILRGAGVAAAVAGETERARSLLASAVKRAPDDYSSAIALVEMTPLGTRSDPSGNPSDRVDERLALAMAHSKIAQARAGAETGAEGARLDRLQSARHLAAAGRHRAAGAIALELAVASDTDLEPVILLAAICRSGGDVDGEAAACIEIAARSTDRARSVRSLRRAAELLDREDGDREAAIDAYWQLCELDGAKTPRDRLAELLGLANDFGSLWELRTAAIERAKTPREKAGRLVERARLRADIADRHGAMRDVKRARTEDAGAAEEAGASALDSELAEWLELPAGADAELACASIAERAQSIADPEEKARAMIDLATLRRDSLGDREGAARAVSSARELDPTNLEAAARAGEVALAAKAIRGLLDGGGGHRATYQKLAAAFQMLGDHDESALVREVAAALAPTPQGGELDIAALEENRRPFAPDEFSKLATSESPPIQALWGKIADAVSRDVDPSPAALGLELSHRIGVRDLAKRSPIAAALYERLRLHSEIYIAEGRKRWFLVTSANRPMIFLSPDLASAASPTARFALGQALFRSCARTGTLERLTPKQLVNYVAAARLIGAGESPNEVGDEGAEPSAEVRALAAKLGKLIPARVTAELKDAAEHSLETLAAWIADAQRQCERFGLAVSGSTAEAIRSVTRSGHSVSNDPRALELLAFAASDRHLELRRALGLTS